MYRVSTLRDAQQEDILRQRLFDWTMTRKMAWEHYVEKYCDVSEHSKGRKYSKPKLLAHLDANIRGVIAWYSQVFIGDLSLVELADDKEHGYPWVVNGKFKCIGGSLQVPRGSAKSKTPTTETKEEPEAVVGTRKCWHELPQALRTVFVSGKDRLHTNLTKLLKEQSLPTAIHVQRMDADKKYESSTQESCFKADMIPKDKPMGLFFNDEWWAFVIKLKAEFTIREPNVRVLLWENKHPKKRAKWSQTLRDLVDVEITKNEPFADYNTVHIT